MVEHGQALTEIVECLSGAWHAVLFDRRVAVEVRSVERVEHCTEVDEPLSERAEDAGLDGFPETELLGIDAARTSGRMSLRCM